MIARVKMKLVGITDYGHESKKLIFRHDAGLHREDRDVSEDVRLNNLGRNYEFETWVDNPLVLEKLKIGDSYCFDVTSA